MRVIACYCWEEDETFPKVCGALDTFPFLSSSFVPLWSAGGRGLWESGKRENPAHTFKVPVFHSYENGSTFDRNVCVFPCFAASAFLRARLKALAADVCGKSLASIGSPSSSLVSFPIAPVQQSELQTTSGAGVTLTGRSQLWPYGPVPLLSSRFLQAQRQSDGMTTGDPPHEETEKFFILIFKCFMISSKSRKSFRLSHTSNGNGVKNGGSLSPPFAANPKPLSGSKFRRSQSRLELLQPSDRN